MTSTVLESCPHDLLAAPRPSAWETLRQRSEEALEGCLLPSPREEDWKYTDLKALGQLKATPGKQGTADLEARILPEARGSRLVFVNGHHDPHASNTSALPPGVRLLPLAQATEAASLLGTLGDPTHQDVFARLNSARFTDGAFLFVPKGVRVEAPIHVLFLARAEEGSELTCGLPRLLVQLEADAEAVLVEEYAGQGATLTCAVSEISLAPGARLSHARLQRESQEAHHFGSLDVRLESESRYFSQSLAFGAKLGRVTPHVALAAEGAALELLSLTMVEGEQLGDTHSRIDHQVPRANTRQLHKAIVDGNGRAVFNGKILVRKDAQQTDARQQCRALLLSEQARVDAKPELEIFADDVKCAHGAAVGQLDPEEVFYLQSRGLDAQDARNVLVFGFASEIIGAIEVPTLRKQLRQMVLERTERH